MNEADGCHVAVDQVEREPQILRARSCAALGALCIFLMPPTLHAQIAQSVFDADSDGWIVADWNTPDLNVMLATYTVTWNAGGGNPRGYISESDPSGNWFSFAAPGKFLGNKSAAFGGFLRYDTFVTASDPGQFPAVMLTGSGQRLYFLAGPPQAAFASYVIPLSPSGWKLNSWQVGVEPTALEMQTVLADLNGLYISGDWLTGTEIAGLDNVSLVPEPSALALLIGGLFSGVFFRRCRALAPCRSTSSSHRSTAPSEA